MEADSYVCPEERAAGGTSGLGVQSGSHGRTGYVAMQVHACGISRPPNLCCCMDTMTFFKIIKGYLPSEIVAKLPSD